MSDTVEDQKPETAEAAPAGDDARIVAVFGERVVGLGEIGGADVIEAGGLHVSLPNRRANRPRLAGAPPV